MVFTPLHFLGLLPFGSGAPAPSSSASEQCALFVAHALGTPGYYVYNATHVSEGAYTVPSGFPSQNVSNKVPFCRVEGTVPYGSNDTLNFELWLPDVNRYNGRFLAVGMSSI